MTVYFLLDLDLKLRIARWLNERTVRAFWLNRVDLNRRHFLLLNLCLRLLLKISEGLLKVVTILLYVSLLTWVVLGQSRVGSCYRILGWPQPNVFS